MPTRQADKEMGHSCKLAMPSPSHATQSRRKQIDLARLRAAMFTIGEAFKVGSIYRHYVRQGVMNRGRTLVVLSAWLASLPLVVLLGLLPFSRGMTLMCAGARLCSGAA